MGRCVYSAVNSPPNTKCTTFSRKLMLDKTLVGEFKLLRIRELDNDDVDVKPDSTDGSFRVRSTNFLLNLRDPPPISMKFGTLADNA